jgi:hypothetical protein
MYLQLDHAQANDEPCITHPDSEQYLIDNASMTFAAFALEGVPTYIPESPYHEQWCGACFADITINR